MNDLVKRLRFVKARSTMLTPGNLSLLGDQAADRIEVLESKLEQARLEISGLKCDAEEQLKALEQARKLSGHGADIWAELQRIEKNHKFDERNDHNICDTKIAAAEAKLAAVGGANKKLSDSINMDSMTDCGRFVFVSLGDLEAWETELTKALEGEQEGSSNE